jgi:hypothetical protein
MATIQQGGSAVTSTSTKNNGGTAIRAGSSATVVENLSLGRTDVGVFGSTVVENSVTENDYAGKGLSAGVFAYNNDGPIAKRITTSLSTVSNSVLRSGAAQPGLVRGIHKLETLRSYRQTTAIRAGNFNIYTGQFSSAPTVAVDTLATDNAASPTRSAPGQLTYKTGKYVPVNDDYKAKTS